MAMGAAAAADTPRHPDELELPPLTYEALRPEKEILPCGIPILTFENHDLPLVYVSIWFPMGKRFLPVERFATCEVLDEAWRSGGTEALDPESLDRVLAELDASVYSWVNERSGGVSVYLVKEDLKDALPLWRDVALHPRFDEDRIDRARKRHLKDIQAINNRPGRIAQRWTDWLTLGRDHPGAHVDSREEIDAVSRKDVSDLHARFIHPEHALIGVHGDFDTADLVSYLNELFGPWVEEAGAYEPLVEEEWPVETTPGVYLLPGDYSQSQIRTGRIEGRLTDTSPDYPAALLANFAFGFGRVFYRTREEGLSYGTAVLLYTNAERSVVAGWGSGRAEATVPLLRAVIEETRRLGDDPLTDEEIEGARMFLIGSEVSEDERARDLVRRATRNRVEGKPEDYRDWHIRGLMESTPEEVNRMAREYMVSTDSLVILVVGDPERFGEPLDSLGFGEATRLEPVSFGE